jgi:hypothetical protein
MVRHLRGQRENGAQSGKVSSFGRGLLAIRFVPAKPGILPIDQTNRIVTASCCFETTLNVRITTLTSFSQNDLPQPASSDQNGQVCAPAKSGPAISVLELSLPENLHVSFDPK